MIASLITGKMNVGKLKITINLQMFKLTLTEHRKNGENFAIKISAVFRNYKGAIKISAVSQIW